MDARIIDFGARVAAMRKSLAESETSTASAALKGLRDDLTALNFVVRFELSDTSRAELDAALDRIHSDLDEIARAVLRADAPTQ